MNKLPEETRKFIEDFYKKQGFKHNPQSRHRIFFCSDQFLENLFKAAGLELTQDTFDRCVRRSECGWLTVNLDGWND